MATRCYSCKRPIQEEEMKTSPLRNPPKFVKLVCGHWAYVTADGKLNPDPPRRPKKETTVNKRLSERKMVYRRPLWKWAAYILIMIAAPVNLIMTRMVPYENIKYEPGSQQKYYVKTFETLVYLLAVVQTMMGYMMTFRIRDYKLIEFGLYVFALSVVFVVYANFEKFVLT